MGTFAAHPDGCQSRRAGFTLIELLVVVAVVSVLLAILIPTLGSARRAAKSLISMQRAKDGALAIIAVSHENDENFPTAQRYPMDDARTLSGAPMTGIPRFNLEEGGGQYSSQYSRIEWFTASAGWPKIINFYHGYDIQSQAILSPSRISGDIQNPQWLFQSDYHVTHALLAPPRFFESTFEQRFSRCQFQRLSDCKHTSRKVLIFEEARVASLRMNRKVFDDPSTLEFDGIGEVRRPFVFFDGHAEQRMTKDATEFVVNNFSGFSAFRQAEACLTTKGGLRGYDF